MGQTGSFLLDLTESLLHDIVQCLALLEALNHHLVCFRVSSHLVLFLLDLGVEVVNLDLTATHGDGVIELARVYRG